MSQLLRCELGLLGLLVSLRELILSLQLWPRLELLALLEPLWLLDGLSSPGVKVWSLLLWVELRSWLLLLLLLLPLLELLLSGSNSVEVGGRLVPGNLLESVSLLELLPGPEDLQPPLSLLLLSKSLPLLHESALLLGLALPDQLVRDDLGQSLQVQLEEHVEGVLLAVLRQTGELRLTELLQLWAECQ